MLLTDYRKAQNDYFGTSATSDSQETPTQSDSSFDSENVDLSSEEDSERSSSPFDALGKNENPAEDIARDDSGDYLFLQSKSNRQMRWRATTCPDCT